MNAYGDITPIGGMKGMPTYVVLDTSGSMQAFEELLNNTLTEIVDTLYTSPAMADFIHLSILSFNSSPHVVMDMTEITQLTALPNVTCSGRTNFAPMFRLVKERISKDVPALKARGIKVTRPVIFLLTDGIPTDKPDTEWRTSHAELTDRNWPPYPHVITYGFGNASESVLKTISTLAAYIAYNSNDEETKSALAAALNSLLNSLITSAEKQQLAVPEEVKGFRTVPLDYIDL
ncbi:vWA domain-containing protein [Herbidospora mongoliensis]|uniref:vWA domain-containing protein n=1 Tax=Herbidospora mongoliensis TaxID=688067 RepID=UPI00082DEA92|nr:VWA domain-containing protein [Herbidospora mongoliensis]